MGGVAAGIILGEELNDFRSLCKREDENDGNERSRERERERKDTGETKHRADGSANSGARVD